MIDKIEWYCSVEMNIGLLEREVLSLPYSLLTTIRERE